jgi:hypothetical protein
MVWLAPAIRLLVTQVATPLVTVLELQVRVVEPSLKATVPVAAMPSVEDMVAVKVAELPAAGVPPDVNATVTVGVTVAAVTLTVLDDTLLLMILPPHIASTECVPVPMTA